MKIETQRLLLRKHELRDFERFWEMISDPVAKQYTGGVTQLEHSDRQAQFKEECEAPFSDSAVEFAVVEKESNKYLGYCGFRFSTEMGANEFLYGFCQDSWGRGYGYEAASAVLQFLFATYSHKKYVATTDAANIASAKILKKLGFRKVGLVSADDVGVVEMYEIDRLLG